MIDALIAAGGVPTPADPLYALTQGAPKALLPLAGRPMVAYVIEALAAVPEVGRILVYGLPEDAVLPAACAARVTRYPALGGLLEHVEAGLAVLQGTPGAAPYVVLSAADIPLLTGAQIAAHIAQCALGEHDFYFSVVAQSVMQARFPHAPRTYLRVREGRFCAGDLHIVRRDAVIRRRELWQGLVAARKNPFQQAALVGVRPLWLALTGRLTLAEGERLCLERLGVHARVVPAQAAELGMDVDKPAHVAIVTAELAARAAL